MQTPEQSYVTVDCQQDFGDRLQEFSPSHSQEPQRDPTLMPSVLARSVSVHSRDNGRGRDTEQICQDLARPTGKNIFHVGFVHRTRY